MARWSANETSWTPVAVADSTSFTAAGYHGFQGGTATQRINVLEVFMGGVAASAAASIMMVARDSQVGTTLTVGRFAALDAASAALTSPPACFNTATTEPQRSSTLSLLALGFNAFGGIVRWVAAPGEEVGMLGNTASLGEISLSAFTGGSPGLMNSHFIVEPF